MLVAITRAVSPSINSCELTFHEQQRIDVEKAGRQHRAYERLLTRLGVSVVSITPEPDMPDAVFVEDTAVVVDEIAVMAMPGAASRRAETASVAEALSPYRPLKHLSLPATLDGGDVMRAGRRLFVGASKRTNPEGVNQLREFLKPFDYEVISVEVRGCLHLKSGCCYIGRNSVLVNRALVDSSQLEGFELVEVPSEEPWAANALLINDVVIIPESFPRTRKLLESRGFKVETVDVSELQKAEGGVTCTSIIFEAPLSAAP
jgi:dimethylargininase